MEPEPGVHATQAIFQSPISLMYMPHGVRLHSERNQRNMTTNELVNFFCAKQDEHMLNGNSLESQLSILAGLEAGRIRRLEI